MLCPQCLVVCGETGVGVGERRGNVAEVFAVN